jgi:hypothetical protein
VDFVPFGEKQLRQIRAVLAGNPGDQRFLHFFRRSTAARVRSRRAFNRMKPVASV